jgi:Fur family ferric uptake transcriptional regulator
MGNIEPILQAFELAGMRITRPRRAMAEQVVVWGTSEKDFSCEDLWHAVQEQYPWIGRATAYRTVQILREFGFVDRVSFSNGNERYHVIAYGMHHHHLTCEQCHRIVEIDFCLPQAVLNDIVSQSGFVLSGHRLELFGYCSQCQQTPPVLSRVESVRR